MLVCLAVVFSIDETVLSGLGVRLKDGGYENQTNKVCGASYATSVTLEPLGAGATLTLAYCHFISPSVNTIALSVTLNVLVCVPLSLGQTEKRARSG